MHNKREKQIPLNRYSLHGRLVPKSLTLHKTRRVCSNLDNLSAHQLMNNRKTISASYLTPNWQRAGIQLQMKHCHPQDAATPKQWRATTCWACYFESETVPEIFQINRFLMVLIIEAPQ